MDDADLKLLAVIIPASASIVAVTLTHAYKVLSELNDKRRSRNMYLVSIRHELLLNRRISKAINDETRTMGFKFTVSAWTLGDTSVIYRHKIPYEEILQIYSDIHMFNLLNERRSIITDQPVYVNKTTRLAIEHAEMIELNEEIGTNIDRVLSAFRPR